MTAHDHSFDELASAYLDDEVTPDERAAVEADTDLTARVEEFRGVRSALAADAPATDDAAISAALAWFGADEDSTAAPVAPAETNADAPPSPTGVTELDARRRRRAARVLPWMAAAAAVAVIAVGIGKLGTGADSKSESAEVSASADKRTLPSVAPEAPALTALEGPAAFPDPEASMATEAPAAEAPATEALAVVDAASATAAGSVPSIDTPDQLIALINQPTLAAAPAGTTAAAEAPTTAAAGDGMPATTLAICGVQGVMYPQPITWQGIPATIYLRPDADNPTEAVVVDGLCDLLATVALAP